MRVGIIGASGYGGGELLRNLHNHPNVSLELLVSNSTQGEQLTEQFPQFHTILDLPLNGFNASEISEQVDILFFATPAGIAKNHAPDFADKGIQCIDLSGDFRLKNGSIYMEWYKNTPAPQEYLEKATYGLPELYRNKIKKSSFISNPGCYPTAAMLGMAPALKSNLANLSVPIIVDGKTGVSGAGRKPSTGIIYAEINENTKAYNLGSHRHTPEMEQAAAEITGTDSRISFNPHIVPMTRGILCTVYIQLDKTISSTGVIQLYEEFYKDDSFIRIRPESNLPATKDVYGTNYCDIGISVDKRTNVLSIISVIDNLGKGAATQAIQNMNLINGWDEQTGLDTVPVYP
ncbi:N-acetyl-gamma-glutamyl-phosphate reductase [Virgibacillus siamensis]|uniref:N-acetyl-gamma-glutamyl-phosphate reductase n=1 Tax=Virgibacillus siamensis TaxID=480071 RepID=UPI0009872D25|nr:N-acetyl-gamma-glutamyl-phosphate reductase [Virgibacillus siamensis]